MSMLSFEVGVAAARMRRSTRSRMRWCRASVMG
jgi:hypothetical protein